MKYTELSDKDKAFLLDSLLSGTPFFQGTEKYYICYVNKPTIQDVFIIPAEGETTAWVRWQSFEFLPPFSVAKPVKRVRIEHLKDLANFSKVQFGQWPKGFFQYMDSYSSNKGEWGAGYPMDEIILAFNLGVEVWGVE